MARHERLLTGDCGEYYVASFLSGMGADVTVERINAPTKDLHVKFGKKSITVQVKTGRTYNHVIRKRKPEDGWWVWRAGKKCMDVKDERHWYAFVSMGTWPKGNAVPKVFFVPSKIVAKTLRENDPTEQDWFWIPESKSDACCGAAGFRTLKKAIAKLKG
jgi:hypothetical protein